MLQQCVVSALGYAYVRTYEHRVMMLMKKNKVCFVFTVEPPSCATLRVLISFVG